MSLAVCVPYNTNTYALPLISIFSFCINRCPALPHTSSHGCATGRSSPEHRFRVCTAKRAHTSDKFLSGLIFVGW